MKMAFSAFFWKEQNIKLFEGLFSTQKNEKRKHRWPVNAFFYLHISKGNIAGL